MSDFETVELYATLEASNNDLYKCNICQSDNFKRDSEKLIEQKKKIKGCSKPVKRNVFSYNGVDFKKCPANFTNKSISELFTAYFNFKNGLLPFNGSLMDQPYKIIEIFNVIDSYMEHEKQKAKDSHGKRRN